MTKREEGTAVSNPKLVRVYNIYIFIICWVGRARKTIALDIVIAVVVIVSQSSFLFLCTHMIENIDNTTVLRHDTPF